MKKIIKLFVICTMAYLCNITAMGQEKIIEVDNHLDETSIIRAVNTKEWLVCNNSNGWSVFSLINETILATPQIHLGNVGNSDKIQIYDFEVFNDTVYFCGSVWFGENQQAVWGYFPLAGFPYVSVKYIVRNIKSLTKLDVFSIDPTRNEIHVVMVGQLDTEKGIVLDELRTAPNQFTEYTSEIYDEIVDFFFSDVAITDNFVVITSNPETLTIGHVLFIRKPTSLYTTIFSCAAWDYIIPGDVSWARLLEHCTNDVVVVVYSSTLTSIGVHSFLGTNPHINLKISTPKLNIADVKFDKKSEDLDILLKPSQLSQTSQDSSVILHLNQSLSYNGGPLFCHKYYDEDLNSLDWIPWENHFFVASGHDKDYSHLRVYKYQYDDWKNCTKQHILWAEKKDTKNTEHYNLLYNDCEIVMQEHRVSEKGLPLIIKCESREQ